MEHKELLENEFGLISRVMRVHARVQPDRRALLEGHRILDYRGLDELMDRLAASLQRCGLEPGEVVAVCASSSIEYCAILLGASRVGVTVALLPTSATQESLLKMLADSKARILFLDAAVAEVMKSAHIPPGLRIITLDNNDAAEQFLEWLVAPDSVPQDVEMTAEAPFSIIYSSGTTDTPKGIVHSFGMRWRALCPAARLVYDTSAVTICSTPLYSNTTLVSFFPAIAAGGSIVLMPRFDCREFLALAARHRVTHAMLVPVQYQRIMALPDFEHFDLSSFRMKFCTSAPFSAELKADILRRWPGGLAEYYGMTEGGGISVLLAHKFVPKLHTVGQPAPGHEIRIIDEEGNEVPKGTVGEIVGRSPTMMSGYLNQRGQTRAAEWQDREGRRFIRTGDIGRFDEDGFLILVDRKKDLIISGGFNVYPSDLEAVLIKHEDVVDAAVAGVPSGRWGETPVAFVVLESGCAASGEQILSWANERLGKTQRLSAVEVLDNLPRSAIGKVLKRELRDVFLQGRTPGLEAL